MLELDYNVSWIIGAEAPDTIVIFHRQRRLAVTLAPQQ